MNGLQRERPGMPRASRWLAAAAISFVVATLSPTLADPELPGPTANPVLVPAGSLVIAMDNDKQNIGAPFNLNAYGLVNHLLWEEIPVKWAIKAGKAKDGIDFTASAARVLPSAVPAATLDFRAGPFIVDEAWADYARQKATEFGNSVAVYELAADTTIDIRYSLLRKVKVGALDDGGNADIHTDILDAAGFDPATMYEVIPTATIVTINNTSCYTVVTEAHFKAGDVVSDPQVQAVQDYVSAGGNFLAQCAGVPTYENNSTYGRFHTTLGIEVNNTSQSFLYPNPDLAYSQFQGDLSNPGGSVQDWNPVAGSVWWPDAHGHARNTPTTDRFAAAATKLVSPGVGSMVFYLGGHSYGASDLQDINGLRMYLNAVFVPSERPNCQFEFPDDPTVLVDISGSVYEDVDGDSDLLDGIGAAGVRVRLYADGNSDGLLDALDTYLAETTTDGNGDYSVQVHTGATGDEYLVAVDSKTVPPSATLLGAQEDVWAQQTYGDDPTTAVVDLGARFGGRTAGVSDDVDPVSTAPADGNYQHVARVDTSGGDVAGIDFGFSFNVVTNARGGDDTDDDGSANRTIQGSLRQFMQNANAIDGANAMRFVPVTTTNALSGGNDWWRISVSEPLPIITDEDTAVDGRAYSAADGASPRNDNAATTGTGGTAGVDGLALTTLDPELEIVAGGNLAVGLNVQAGDCTLRGVAIYGFGDEADNDAKANIRVSDVSGTLIEQCVVGATAASFADPASGANADNIRVVAGDGGIVRNSLIGFSGGNGVGCKGGVDGWLFQGNEIAGNGSDNTALGGINLNDGNVATIRGNLLRGNHGPGIDMDGSTGSHTIENNTVEGNGVGEQITPGVRLYGDDSTIDRNILHENLGAGLMITDAAVQNTITRNSMYDNGTIGSPTGQIGIDLLSGSDDGNEGSSPFVTLNESGDFDTGANDLLNYPILLTANVVSGVLELTGFARPDSEIEFFVADADPSGFGEGRSYQMTLTEGSGADTDGTTGSYGPGAINGVAQGQDTTNRFRFVITRPAGITVGAYLTATATDASGNTSEFSGNVEVTGTLGIVKRAFTPTGDPIADSSEAPRGSLVKFLIYINNTGAALNDVSVQDVLDPAFEYQAGTIKIDNSVNSCAAMSCTAAEESTIFASVDGQTPTTDLVDPPNVVSYTVGTVTIDAGDEHQGNGQLNIAAAKVWAISFTVRVR